MISNAQKKLLHTAKNALHLDDEDYRAILHAEAGVSSSNDLDNRGLNRVLKRLGKLGFKNTAHRPHRPQPKALISAEQQNLIADNYRRLGFDTFPRQTGFNRRCCGKALPQTRTDANKVIEGQKAMIARADAQKPVQCNEHRLFDDQMSADRNGADSAPDARK
jgi:phage gp16-like protein